MARYGMDGNGRTGTHAHIVEAIRTDRNPSPIKDIVTDLETYREREIRAQGREDLIEIARTEVEHRAANYVIATTARDARVRGAQAGKHGRELLDKVTNEEDKEVLTNFYADIEKIELEAYAAGLEIVSVDANRYAARETRHENPPPQCAPPPKQRMLIIRRGILGDRVEEKEM